MNATTAKAKVILGVLGLSNQLARVGEVIGDDGPTPPGLYDRLADAIGRAAGQLDDGLSDLPPPPAGSDADDPAELTDDQIIAAAAAAVASIRDVGLYCRAALAFARLVEAVRDFAAKFEAAGSPECLGAAFQAVRDAVLKGV